NSTTTHLEVNDYAFDNPNTWDDLNTFIPEPSPEAGPSKRARVEEVDDEDSIQVRQSVDTKNRRFIKAYPRPVGIAIGQGVTKFQVLYEKHMEQGQSIYAPF